jgi:hypothetical protein
VGEILDALLDVVTTDPNENDRSALFARAREYCDSKRARTP